MTEFPEYDADRMSHARARETEGLRKLRKGQDECTATCRNGQPCRAPAVEGALVCRRHGGAASQVQIKAKHRVLQMALYVATREFEEAYGTPGEFDALCQWSKAKRELDEYETKLRRLAELRAELKRQRAEAARCND